MSATADSSLPPIPSPPLPTERGRTSATPIGYISKGGLAVPLTDPNLTPDLELTDAHGAALAQQGAQQQGITLSDDQFLTGWWRVQDDYAERLVEERAPILGVTGGLVTRGAWTEALATVRQSDLKKAFVVTRMTDVELEDYRGRVTRINHTGTYFRR